jgi:glycosyltransferase involved in cell wall biosynthesis
MSGLAAGGGLLPPGQRPLVMAATVDLGALDGPALHVLNLARQLAALGHAVTLISPAPRRPIGQSLVGGVELRHAGRAGRPPWLNALNALPMALAIWRSKPRGKRLYLRSGPATAVLAALARAAGVSHVVAEYNGWLADEIDALGYPRALSRLARVLQRAEARRADRVRVVTSGLKAVLIAEGIEEAKVAVIGNGTDIGQFRPLDPARCRAELGIAGDGPVLAFVGNLWPVVDLDVVFEAMSILVRRGRETRILIAGDGVRRVPFERKARALLGEGGARFLGHLSPERTNLLLGAADVAVAPFHRRRNERIGLSPLKIRDYAAAGRPCVATDLGGIDALRGEPWMFLARPGCAPAHADAIAAALAADRAGMCRSARAYAERHFDWSVVARQVSALIP